ncbi:MAG: metal ABC transporter permease, partial [Planctomycetaceae bacterium]|nr:metal ABC transporter permease [Planctomycetaceae bacterium]
MQRAFLIGAVAAIPFGLIGTFVIVRRIGYLAGAIAHCAFGGIGIGLY